MNHFEWNSIRREQLNPLFTRQMIHGESLTVARLTMSKGAQVPEHHHINEQISLIETGAMRFVVDGKEVIVRAGEALVIPSNVPHSAETLEDTTAIDIFTPVREDWVRGDDAYLRDKR